MHQSGILLQVRHIPDRAGSAWGPADRAAKRVEKETKKELVRGKRKGGKTTTKKHPCQVISRRFAISLELRQVRQSEIHHSATIVSVLGKRCRKQEDEEEEEEEEEEVRDMVGRVSHYGGRKKRRIFAVIRYSAPTRRKRKKGRKIVVCIQKVRKADP